MLHEVNIILYQGVKMNKPKIFLKKSLFILLVLSTTVVTSLYGQNCDSKTYIPDKAKKLLPIVYEEVYKILGNDFNYPFYFPALIEHESCVKLCGNNYWAKRCWSPKSRLKTKREEGAGFFQLTRVFNKTGRVKWDTIEYLRKRFPKELHELNWNNVYERPDLQIKAGILLWKSNFIKFSKNIPIETRIAFADSVYNGGWKYFRYERKYCGLIKNCDPNKWFGNVEKIKSKRARRKLYGNRTAWDINRHHVKDVIKNRMSKYMKDYLENGYDIKIILGDLVEDIDCD